MVGCVQPTPSPPPLSGSYAPGWYPDPTRRNEYRFYNGQIWTGDVSNHGEQRVDPLLNPVQHAVFVPASRRNGFAIAAFVLAIGAIVVGWIPFVCFLAAIGLILALIFAVIGRRRSNTMEGKGRIFATWALVLLPFGFASVGVGIVLTSKTVREFSDFIDVGEYQLTDGDCAVSDGVVTYTGRITNRSASSQSYHLTFTFYRPGTTNPLYTGSDDVQSVQPGKSGQWLVVHSVNQDELDCRVTAVSGPLPFQS
jgi:Protein of unknown function (DUF2510)